MSDIREFFHAVGCDHRDRSKNLLLKLGGLGAIFERRNEFPLGDVEGFLVHCDALVNPRKAFSHVKWLFDCRKTPERDDRFIDWAISCSFDVFPTAEFLVAIGRQDAVPRRLEFTCPIQFLDAEDRFRIDLAERMAERMQVSLPAVQRSTDIGIADAKSPLSFESLAQREPPSAPITEQEAEFVATMRRVCARNTADWYMQVTLTGRKEFDDQIIAALRSKHPRKKIFHGRRKDSHLARGFPGPHSDSTWGKENPLTFYLFRSVPITNVYGIISKADYLAPFSREALATMSSRYN